MWISETAHGSLDEGTGSQDARQELPVLDRCFQETRVSVVGVCRASVLQGLQPVPGHRMSRGGVLLIQPQEGPPWPRHSQPQQPLREPLLGILRRCTMVSSQRPSQRSPGEWGEPRPRALTKCWSLSRCTTRDVQSPMGTRSGDVLYRRSKHRAALCFTLSMVSLKDRRQSHSQRAEHSTELHGASPEPAGDAGVGLAQGPGQHSGLPAKGHLGGSSSVLSTRRPCSKGLPANLLTTKTTSRPHAAHVAHLLSEQ